MAKMWGVTQGKIAQEQNQQHQAMLHNLIESEYRKKNNTPKLGIKSSVMIVYAEKGKIAAWQALQEYNKKLSGGGFTLEMLEQWIGEYERKQAQRMGKDDGRDR